MSDAINLFFECKNPRCIQVHKRLLKKTIGSPKLFLSEVLGTIERTRDRSTGQLIAITFDCHYGTILLYSVDNAPCHSAVRPIKNGKTCDLCTKILTESKSLDNWSENK